MGNFRPAIPHVPPHHPMTSHTPPPTAHRTPTRSLRQARTGSGGEGGGGHRWAKGVRGYHNATVCHATDMTPRKRGQGCTFRERLSIGTATPAPWRLPTRCPCHDSLPAEPLLPGRPLCVLGAEEAHCRCLWLSHPTACTAPNAVAPDAVPPMQCSGTLPSCTGPRALLPCPTASNPEKPPTAIHHHPVSATFRRLGPTAQRFRTLGTLGPKVVQVSGRHTHTHTHTYNQWSGAQAGLAFSHPWQCTAATN